MDIAFFEENEALKKVLKRVDEELVNKIYSDVVDDAGHQYIDLVMEGGGMLGIAHIGYIYVLERAKIRFLGIGGASAGSINALVLAALGTPDETKGAQLLKALANKNFYDFVDGGRVVRWFINALLAKPKNIPVIVLTFAFRIAYCLWSKWGINPGDAFQNWIRDILKSENIHNTAQLKARIETVPQGLRVIDRRKVARPRKDKYITSQDDICARLAMITADVSTESKIEFPKMAKLYWENPDAVDPSEYVRASMSIPYFFYPHKVNHLCPSPTTKKDWYDETGYKYDEEAGLPKQAIFIDGGIMSNFPIDVFHTPNKVPIRPTFGVKLELDNRHQHIKNPKNLLGSIFNASRHTLDYDFIFKNPDYRHLVKHIPAEGYNWLDFNMSDEHKLELFIQGAQCAEEFLSGFDWEKYKDLRKSYAKQYEVGEELKVTVKNAIKETQDLR